MTTGQNGRVIRRRVLAISLLLGLAALSSCGTVDETAERPVAPAPTLPATDATTVPEPTTTVAATTDPAATTVAETTVAETTVASTVAPTAQAGTVSLRPDGLGVAAFGTEAAAAEAALVASLGPPDEDSGWVDAVTSPFGVCPGTQVRGLRWGPLQVLFTDEGATRVFTYVYASSLVKPGEPIAAASGLQTPEGIGLGTALADLQAAYPSLSVTTDLYGPTFLTAAGGLSGTLSAETADGFVTSLIGGVFCGE